MIRGHKIQTFDKKLPYWKAFFITQGFSLLWEIKDGLFSYKKYGYWGGDGFSYRDHAAATIGQIGQLLFDHVLLRDPPTARDRLKKGLYYQL